MNLNKNPCESITLLNLTFPILSAMMVQITYSHSDPVQPNW